MKMEKSEITWYVRSLAERFGVLTRAEMHRLYSRRNQAACCGKSAHLYADGKGGG
jgi:hypothetical protein